MKLRTLFEDRSRIISEAISREDFFDFYALVNAFDEPHFIVQDPEWRSEVKRRLIHVVDEIYHDQMSQLHRILQGRSQFLNPKPISPDDKLVWDPWRDTVRKYMKSKEAKTLRDKILVIDSIYGLLHEGGPITDHFRGEEWLEDAINIRSMAAMDEILNYASDDVRDLLSSAQYGIIGKSKVSELQKMLTSIYRWPSGYSHDLSAELRGDTIFGQMAHRGSKPVKFALRIDGDMWAVSINNSPFERVYEVGDYHNSIRDDIIAQIV